MAYKPPSARKLANVDLTLPPRFEEAQKENDKSIFSFSKINFFKHNPQRASFFQLLKRIGAKDPEVRLKALIYEYVNTDDTPKIPFTNFKITNGSMMHKVLGEFLNISEDKKEINANILSKGETFTYVQNFYDYVNKNISDDDVKDLVWGTKEKLLADVHACLLKVHKRMHKENDAFFHSFPDELNAMMAALEETIQSYSNINDHRKYPNLERRRQIQLWRFILKTAKETYIFDQDKLESSPADRRNYGELRCIIMAMQMAMFQIIENKSWGINGSKLCSIGLRNLNQDKINRMKAHVKVHLFSRVRDHLITMQQDGLYFKTVKKEWEELKIPDFIKELNEINKKAASELNAPGMTRKLANEGITSGAGAAAGRAAVMLAPALITVLPVSFGGSTVLVAIFAAGTAVSMLPLGWVGSKVSETGKWLLNSILKKVGELGGVAFATFMTRVMAAENKGEPVDLFNLIFLPEDEMEAKRNLIAAWLAAPDDIITRKEKDQIRIIINLHKGLEKEELPKVTWFKNVP